MQHVSQLVSCIIEVIESIVVVEVVLVLLFAVMVLHEVIVSILVDLDTLRLLVLEAFEVVVGLHVHGTGHVDIGHIIVILVAVHSRAECVVLVAQKMATVVAVVGHDQRVAGASA